MNHVTKVGLAYVSVSFGYVEYGGTIFLHGAPPSSLHLEEELQEYKQDHLYVCTVFVLSTSQIHSIHSSRIIAVEKIHYTKITIRSIMSSPSRWLLFFFLY